MKQVQGTSLLVTVAEDLSSEPVLKVWALDKLEKRSGIPKCQSTLQLQNGRKQFPVSCHRLDSLYVYISDLSDLGFRGAGGPFAACRGFRKRSSDGCPRRSNT